MEFTEAKDKESGNNTSSWEDEPLNIIIGFKRRSSASSYCSGESKFLELSNPISR